MNEEVIVRLGQDAIKTMALVAGPMLIATMVIGLAVSIFQALTQINEATLTFIPKMIIIGLIILFGGHWMLTTMSTYTVNLFENVASIVRE
jgi:flagellar biosynthetic protein FliQ